MDNNIKRIYIGLPNDLIGSVLWVSRNFRTNPLSNQPGGSDVVVEYHNDGVLGYDWIKYPSRYVRAIMGGHFKNGVLSDIHSQLETFRLLVKRMYARKYPNEVEFSNVPFTEIWNYQTSTELPWDKLITYDQDYVEESLYTYADKNIIYRVTISTFKQITKMDRLQFKRIEGIPIAVCNTPVGLVHLASDIDLTQPVEIILVGDTLDVGLIWVVNTQIS